MTQGFFWARWLQNPVLFRDVTLATVFHPNGSTAFKGKLYHHWLYAPEHRNCHFRNMGQDPGPRLNIKTVFILRRPQGPVSMWRMPSHWQPIVTERPVFKFVDPCDIFKCITWRKAVRVMTFRVVFSDCDSKILQNVPEPFYLISIPAWVGYYIINKWDEFIYQSPNINGATVKVWEWIGDFIPHFMMDVITYSCWY